MGRQPDPNNVNFAISQISQINFAQSTRKIIGTKHENVDHASINHGDILLAWKLFVVMIPDLPGVFFPGPVSTPKTDLQVRSNLYLGLPVLPAIGPRSTIGAAAKAYGFGVTVMGGGPK